ESEQNKPDRAHGSFVGWLCDCSRYWDYCRARGVGSKKTRQKSRSKWPKPATTRLHPGRTLVGPRPPRPAYCSGRFPRLAPPYKISVALLRSVTSCFGCSTNVNESFPLIAAALDEDLRLEIDAPAFDIVTYVVAVFLWCQSSRRPFAGVDTQPSHVAILLCGSVSNLNAFLEEFVRLRLARARVSLKKVPVVPQPGVDRLL